MQNQLSLIQKLPLFQVFFLAFALLWSAETNAQFNKEIGDWESHLPLQIAKHVTQSDEYIYYSTELSINRIDKEEFVGQFYSKIDGFSEVGVSQIAYDKQGDQLIVAYVTGAIDIVNADGTIQTIQDLKLNTTFIEKEINKIIVTDNRRILYATRFGILVQNADNYFFEFTTNMETEVFELTQRNNELYAATAEGIYKFIEADNSNPGDFTKWELQDGEVGLPAIYEAKDIEVFGDELYAIVDNQVYKTNAGAWELFDAEENRTFQFISSEGSDLLIGGFDDGVSFIDLVKSDGSKIPSTTCCGNSMVDAIQTEDGSIWYADNWHGIRHQSEHNKACSSILFNSPYSERAREIRIKDSEPYIASGGINENFLFDSNRNGFYVKRNGGWINYNENTTVAMKDSGMINFLVAQPHPTKDIIYAGAFPGGLLEINNETGKREVFNSNSSPLEGTPSLVELVRIPELKFDDDENLWVITYNAEFPLHVLTKDRVWHNYKFGNTTNLGAVEFDDFGHIWMPLVGSTGGVIVFNHKGTLADPTDDEFKIFRSTNSELPSGKVFTIKRDLEGDMWVGTQNGPVIFECGNVFTNSNCTGSTRKVLEDSIPAPLLATEFITTIAVDGANRKWLGTTTGIYVQSSSGEDQVFRYTTENSPLFDNNIIDLEYDPFVGEMYIATDKGVQSLRIDATGATTFFNTSELYTFPNPVRPGWDGPIAIRGLAEDANVKITDIQGRLVFETTANGGTAIWDGFNYSGRKAKTGVYIVYASYTKSQENIVTETTKILFVD